MSEKWRWELVKWVPYLVNGFIIGVGIASILDWNGGVKNYQIASWLVLGISAPLLIIFLLIQKISWSKKLIFLILLIIIIEAGVFRYYSDAQSMRAILKFSEKKVQLTGVVLAEPKIKLKNQQIILDVEQINGQNNEKEKYWGRILIFTSYLKDIRYGDRILIIGKIKKPSSFNNFDYPKYLAKDKIYLIAYYPKIKILNHNSGLFWREKIILGKDYLEGILEKSVPFPEGALAEGLVFGDRRNFSPWLNNKLKNAGLIHLTALSGLHIMLIIYLLERLRIFFCWSKKYSFWLIGLMILIFVLMTGSHPSAVRAMIMGLVFLFGLNIGRLYSIPRALVLTAGIMVIINPRLLFFDLGFQLSFLAVLGSVYLGNYLNEKITNIDNKFFKKYKNCYFFNYIYNSTNWMNIIRTVEGIFTLTLSIQIFTLPLIIFYFHQYPYLAIISNLLVIPLIPWLMILILLTVLAGLFYLPLGEMIGFLVWGMSLILIEIVKILG